MGIRSKLLETDNRKTDKFTEVSDSRANRIGANRVKKKHMQKLTLGIQLKVAIGRYPNGREVILDGHSRKAAWLVGALEKPETLSVDVYEILCFEDEIELIDIFCGKASVSTPKEKAEQSRNRNALNYHSELCRSSWEASLKLVGYINADEGYKVFSEPMNWLDQFGLTTKNTKRYFSAGVRAAFLESFTENRQQAEVFWRDYVKGESELEVCRILKEELDRQDGWGGATSAHFKRATLSGVRRIQL